MAKSDTILGRQANREAWNRSLEAHGKRHIPADWGRSCFIVTCYPYTVNGTYRGRRYANATFNGFDPGPNRDRAFLTPRRGTGHYCVRVYPKPGVDKCPI